MSAMDSPSILVIRVGYKHVSSIHPPYLIFAILLFLCILSVIMLFMISMRIHHIMHRCIDYSCMVFFHYTLYVLCSVCSVYVWNCLIALKFDRHIGSTAAEVPVKFQSDRTILNTNLAASRLYEILRKDVFSDIETGPRFLDVWKAQADHFGSLYVRIAMILVRESLYMAEQSFHRDL